MGTQTDTEQESDQDMESIPSEIVTATVGPKEDKKKKNGGFSFKNPLLPQQLQERTPAAWIASTRILPTNAKAQKVTPIVISEQKSRMVSRKMIHYRKNRINILSPIATEYKFILLYLMIIMQLGTINQWFYEVSHDYHSFKLPEETTQRAKLRGIPHYFPTTNTNKIWPTWNSKWFRSPERTRRSKEPGLTWHYSGYNSPIQTKTGTS